MKSRGGKCQEGEMRLEVSRLRVKCQKVEVKHTLSRSSDLVRTNEGGEC